MSSSSTPGSKNQINIKLKPGATEADVAAELKKHHKTIADLHAQGEDASILFPGKNVPPPVTGKNVPGGH